MIRKTNQHEPLLQVASEDLELDDLVEEGLLVDRANVIFVAAIIAVVSIGAFFLLYSPQFTVQLTTSGCWSATIDVRTGLGGVGTNSMTTNPSGCGSQSWQYTAKQGTVVVTGDSTVNLVILKDGGQCGSNMGSTVASVSCSVL